MLAQATSATNPPTTSGDAKPEWFKVLQSPMVPIMGMLAIFYIFMFRSKRKQDTQKKQQLEQLKRGDEIQTIGGIIGTVVEARENEVIVKVDETNNTKMKFSRNAIHRVLEPKTKDAK
jgi:preprotein translocase subunit YajC